MADRGTVLSTAKRIGTCWLVNRINYVCITKGRVNAQIDIDSIGIK